MKNILKKELGEKTNKIVGYIATGIIFFFLIDLFVRIPSIKFSNYCVLHSYSSIIFIFFYSFFILFLEYILPKKISKIINLVISISLILLALTNYFLIRIKREPLSIYLLLFSKEGAKYTNTIVKEIKLFPIAMLIICIVIAILNYKFLKEYKEIASKEKKRKKKPMIIGIIIIIVLYLFGRESLYFSFDKTNYQSAISFYNNHSTNVDSIITLSFYEYMSRDIYFSLRHNNLNESMEKEKEIREKYKRENEENEYTGIFKDKNLIMILLESMDERIINEENTPTLLKMRKEGLNFTNRYSFYAGSGSTIGTEYTSITGLIGDNHYRDQIFSRKYDDAIPAVFKQNGYQTQSMHENTGEFYYRNILHPNYYFDNSYFLMDISDNVIPYTDAQMVDNDEFYDEIIPKNNEKFMSYITTISAHGPYTKENEECKNTKSELECFTMLAKRTDEFLDHLLKRLEEDDLLEDTVIVMFTDHYAYTYSYEKEYLEGLKTIDRNHTIKSIPFIIYNADLEHKDIEDILVNDIDIVPTLLNMFGIDYDPNAYIGTDLFSKDHRNLIIFVTHTWYDGKVFSPYSNPLKYDNYKEKEEYASDMLIKNEVLLNYNYEDLK